MTTRISASWWTPRWSTVPINEFRDVYEKWFGRIDERTLSIYRLSALPE